ncbi:hypothetical protein Tco_0535154 [Tanacetum coccineum]
MLYLYRFNISRRGRFAPAAKLNLKQLPEPPSARSQDDSFVTLKISTVVGWKKVTKLKWENKKWSNSSEGSLIEFSLDGIIRSRNNLSIFRNKLGECFTKNMPWDVIYAVQTLGRGETHRASQSESSKL